MALYLLYESSSRYALFLANGLDVIGQNTESVRNSVADLYRFGKVVKLVAFTPVESALDALNQCNAVSEVVARSCSTFALVHLQIEQSGRAYSDLIYAILVDRVLGHMPDELRNFLELTLPKVKEGKMPKFSLGLQSLRLDHIFLKSRRSPAKVLHLFLSFFVVCGCILIGSWKT